jgi:hypothetical protein
MLWASARLTAFYFEAGSPCFHHRQGSPVFCWLLRGKFGKASKLVLRGGQMKSADKLIQFRKQVERETDMKATDVKVPLSSFLDDVCRLLGLSTKTRRKVLGRTSYTRLENDRVWIDGKVEQRSPRD